MSEKEEEKQCPECLEWVSKEEFDMFAGFCEECTGAFDEE